MLLLKKNIAIHAKIYIKYQTRITLLQLFVVESGGNGFPLNRDGELQFNSTIVTEKIFSVTT